jgi:hypothetical protein
MYAFGAHAAARDLNADQQEDRDRDTLPAAAFFAEASIRAR